MKSLMLILTTLLTNEFMYLNGDVIHYKVINEGHGASRAIDEEILVEFSKDGDERKK